MEIILKKWCQKIHIFMIIKNKLEKCKKIKKK